jgi:hypothetical protein
MTQYAAKTEVSPEKSRAEIEATLNRYGATAFSYGWEESRAVLAFKMHDRHVRFEIAMPLPDEERFHQYKRGDSWHKRTEEAAKKEWQQAIRQRWRALALVVKAKLEAVESGITEFEAEFMAHIVMPDGRTVGQHIRPQIKVAYESGEMPTRLLPAYGGTE